MSTDSKVLTFPGKKKNGVEEQEVTENTASVVDISEMRKEMIADERRSVRRTILTEFIGVHLVIPGLGLQKCSLYDISEKGLAFDLEHKQGRFQSSEQVAMRVYLNHKTYFGFLVTINNVRLIEDDGVFRHGASFIPGTVNLEALTHFVKFIESVSASLKTDHGDVIVTNLDSDS